MNLRRSFVVGRFVTGMSSWRIVLAREQYWLRTGLAKAESSGNSADWPTPPDFIDESLAEAAGLDLETGRNGLAIAEPNSSDLRGFGGPGGSVSKKNLSKDRRAPSFRGLSSPTSVNSVRVHAFSREAPSADSAHREHSGAPRRRRQRCETIWALWEARVVSLPVDLRLGKTTPAMPVEYFSTSARTSRNCPSKTVGTTPTKRAFVDGGHTRRSAGS